MSLEGLPFCANNWRASKYAVAHVELGVEHIRDVRGVKGLPGSLTRCLGVTGSNASLNLVVDGVLNSTGGTFSSIQFLARVEYSALDGIYHSNLQMNLQMHFQMVGTEVYVCLKPYVSMLRYEAWKWFWCYAVGYPIHWAEHIGNFAEWKMFHPRRVYVVLRCEFVFCAYELRRVLHHGI